MAGVNYFDEWKKQRQEEQSGSTGSASFRSGRKTSQAETSYFDQWKQEQEQARQAKTSRQQYRDDHDRERQESEALPDIGLQHQKKQQRYRRSAEAAKQQDELERYEKRIDAWRKSAGDHENSAFWSSDPVKQAIRETKAAQKSAGDHENSAFWSSDQGREEQTRQRRAAIGRAATEGREAAEQAGQWYGVEQSRDRAGEALTEAQKKAAETTATVESITNLHPWILRGENPVNDYERQVYDEYQKAVKANEPAVAAMREAQADYDRLNGAIGARDEKEAFDAELRAAYQEAASSGAGTEEWYGRKQEERQNAKDAMEAARKRAEAAKTGMSAGMSAGEFSYMFEDERTSAAEEYEEATAEYERLAKEYEEAEHALAVAGVFRFADVMSDPEFEEKAAMGLADVEERRAAAQQEMNAAGYRAITYSDNFALAVQNTVDMERASIPLDELPTDQWTEEERKLYGYLHQRDTERGTNDAAEYGRSVNTRINQGIKDLKIQDITDDGGLAMAGRSVLARGANLLSGVDYLDKLLEYWGKGYTTVSPNITFTDYGRAVDSEISRRMNEWSGTLPEDWAVIGGKGVGDLYQVGMSAADSALAVFLLGEGGSLASMGLRSASNAFQDAMDRGADTGTALWYGAVNGATEIFFEKFSVDRLLDEKKTLAKSFLRNMAEQGGVEMSEEMATSFANAIEDVLILKEKGELETSIRDLVNSGMSYDEASKQVMSKTVQGILYDGLAGFASGGMMVGAHELMKLPGTTATGNEIIRKGRSQELIQEALGSQSEIVREFAEDMQSGKIKTDAKNIGRLLNMYQVLEAEAESETAAEAENEADAEDEQREAAPERAAETREEGAGGEIERAASVHGEDAKVIEAMYRDGQNADDYAAAMDTAINLLAAEGTNRKALDLYSLTRGLTKEQKDAAWEVGHAKYTARQQRAAAQSSRGAEREVTEIRRGTVRYDGATIDDVKYGAVDLTKLGKTERRQVEACASFAEAAGINLVYFDGGTSNVKGAYREGGTVYLNVRAGKANGETLIVSTFSHELTHFAEEKGGESYQALRSYVMQSLAGNDRAKFEQIVEAKRKSRGGLSYEEALSEVVADGCEMMLRDTNAPAMLARENPTLLRQICEWLDGWVKKIKAAFEGVSARHEEARILMEQAEELQRLWDRALAEAVQNREALRTENETTAEDGGRVQYSKDYDYSKSFSEQIEDYKKGKIPAYDTLIVSGTPTVFQKIGLNPLPMTFSTSHLQDILAGVKVDHDFGEALLKQLPDKLKEPIAIFVSSSRPKTSVVALVDLEHNGKRIITPVIVDGFGTANGVLIDTNAIASVHKRGNAVNVLLRNAIKNEAAGNVGVFYYDKAKATGILNTSELQLLGLKSDANGFIHSIRETGSPVKPKFSNATESKQFKRWFRKSQAVNPDGTPKIFYHGTASEFWAFDMKKSNDKLGRRMGLGAGKGKIYLTEYEASARRAAEGAKTRTKGGSERVLALYVSAQKIMNRADYQRILERNYAKYPNSRPGSTGYDYLQRDKAISATDKEIRAKGYDAVYDPGSGEMFVYENTQVKSATDNIGLFDPQNPDIRYSEEDNSVSDRELLLEAAEREGAGEELRRYAQKARNLEAYQKRLDRQQKKLGAEGISEKERAALEKRIAETERLIARTQEDMTQMELRPGMQQAVQEARVRWWTENIPDAVQTAREIQRENRELKEAVEYYREQAKLSTPEGRRVDPADVKRFTRALLKEHGSDADAAQVARAIQKLGDKLVQGSGSELSSQELNKLARDAARMIVDEVYKDVNEDSVALRREIADRVRNTRLQISKELRGDISDFNAWRRARLGRLTLVNEGGTEIDSFYQALVAEYGEGLFPPDITAASDQLTRIDDILNRLGPKWQYAYTQMEHDEMVQLVSREIMDTVLSGEIREAETIADRNYRKMQERMLNAREAQQRAERAAKSAERRAENAEQTALRQAREEQKAITREKVKALRQELNNSREAQQKRVNIERMRARLSRLLRENSAKNHVPEALRGQIGRFIQSLDTLGPFSEGTRSEAKFQEEMKELALALRSVKDSEELNDFYGDLEMTEGVRVMLQNNIDAVEAAIKANKGTVTRRMNLEQLRALEETLTVLSTAVKNVNELLSDGEHRFAHVDELGESTIGENRDINEVRTQTGRLGKQLKWQNLTPYYAFKRFGEAGREILRGITRGWGKMARHVQEIQDYAERTYTAEEVKGWEKKEHSFELVPRSKQPKMESAVLSGSMDLKADAETVTLTEAQIMSLYLLNKREQARGHLYGAGIRIGDIQKGTKTVTQSEHYLLDLDDMAKILQTLSPRQIEVCEALSKYMNTTGSSWGNEVSMKLYGIRGFTEENYFPIRTDSTQHKARTADSERGNLFRLANQSFTKQTTKNANNAIIVDSVFDVFADHMADMAKYNALVLPMLDAMRWFNYQGERTSVQQSLQRAFGSDAGRYFKDFMQDLNGATEGGRGEEWYGRLSSGVKVASVGANVRVALQQPTSIARAALLLDPKYLAKGAAVKGGRAKALQYSGLAVWKDLGYFDVNVNRGMREQIKHADTLKEKIQDKSLWLAEKGDQMTWGALWNACELETAEKTGLSGEELMQKTAERFDEVILATQVMDSTLTRSANMRSKSALLKEFTAFMAEPTLTYNMLLDCWSEYDKAQRRFGDREAAYRMRGKILRTATVYVCSAALTAVAQAAGDAGRDDDEYETLWEKFWQHYPENFIDNLNPLKLLPIISQVWGISAKQLSKLDPFDKGTWASNAWQTAFNGRDMELLGLQPIQQTWQAVQIWAETIALATGRKEKATDVTWYGNMTTYGAIYKSLQAFSSWSGLPMGAATREFQSMYNTVLRPMLKGALGKELPRWTTYDSGPKGAIKNALAGGFLDKYEAKQLLVEEGVAKDNEEAARILYGWEAGETSVYREVRNAAIRGDEESFRMAMQAMTDAGYKESEVLSQVRTAIREQYLQPTDGPELSKAYCIDYLQRFGGWSREEAEKKTQEWTCYKVTGITFEDIFETWQSGEISEARAVELYGTYGGKDREAAQAWFEKKKFDAEFPEYRELSDSAFSYYQSSASPLNIPEGTFYAFWKDTKSGVMKSDTDEDGRPIKGRERRDKVVAYIAGLNLAPAQKDALYLMYYKEKSLGDTPWHK